MTEEFSFLPSTTSDLSADVVKETSTASTPDSFLTSDFTLDPPEGKTDVPLSKPQDKEKEEEDQPPKTTKKSQKLPPKTTIEPIQPENPPQFKYKQVILVRTDLNLTPNNLAAQVAHASVNAFNATSPLTRKSWLDEGHRKIILQVADATALTHFYTQAQALHLPEGNGVPFPNPSEELAVIAIGPALNEAIDPLTAQLKLY
jgi:PTH2 family peptidyl-tRNA hydrolase